MMTARCPAGFRRRPDLRREATPQPLLGRPVHRWFVFPHSFGAGLVEAVLDRWGLDDGAVVLDPFAGAGTTLRTARERGMDAVGFDLSPLAVLASRAKVRRYQAKRLRAALSALARVRSAGATEPAPRLLRRALGRHGLGEALALRERILRLPGAAERDFCLLALVRAAREVSAAHNDGGWLRWVARAPRAGALSAAFARLADEMLRDVESGPAGSGRQRVSRRDARRAPPPDFRFDGVLTSPPYPNRHDYTRVFAVELLLAFLDERALFRLRYQSLRSHVEARVAAEPAGYAATDRIRSTLAALRRAPVTDRRVAPMVDGYFRDLWAHLRALRPALRAGAPLAYVVGNVRHAGVMVAVDEILAELAEQLGYRVEGGWVIRERGNSAQQMKQFGRQPAREAVVFLQNPP